MPQAARLDIITGARNETRGVIGEVRSDLEGLTGTTSRAGLSLSGLFSIYMLRRVADFSVETVKLGAQTERLATSFNALAGRINATSDSILAAMRRASNGAISDASLMQSAMRAVDFNVARSTDDLVGLLEVAQDRARRAGIDTQTAYKRLILGIGQLSPRILDDLNVIWVWEFSLCCVASAFDTPRMISFCMMVI